MTGSSGREIRSLHFVSFRLLFAQFYVTITACLNHANADPPQRTWHCVNYRAQKEISVSEFFAKNRHLLGFDNPRKALLTTVKEAVDNSLDACEEGGILPEVWIHIESVGKDKYKVAPQDNNTKTTVPASSKNR